MRILKPGEYHWKETQGGTGWSLLRHDPQHDTQTRLLRYTRGVGLPAVELDHTVEWLLLRGEARCGPLTLRRRGFYCWPMGERRDGVVPGEEGYSVLSFVYGPRSGIRKPGVAIDSLDTGRCGGPELEAITLDAFGREIPRPKSRRLSQLLA